MGGRCQPERTMQAICGSGDENSSRPAGGERPEYANLLRFAARAGDAPLEACVPHVHALLRRAAGAGAPELARCLVRTPPYPVPRACSGCTARTSPCCRLAGRRGDAARPERCRTGLARAASVVVRVAARAVRRRAAACQRPRARAPHGHAGRRRRAAALRTRVAGRVRRLCAGARAMPGAAPAQRSKARSSAMGLRMASGPWQGLPGTRGAGRACRAAWRARWPRPAATPPPPRRPSTPTAGARSWTRRRWPRTARRPTR